MCCPSGSSATLSYAAMIDPELQRVLTARAPLALLESDGAVFDARTRLAVVEGVFALARRLPGRVTAWDHGPLLSRFADEACDERLAEILSNERKRGCRWLALWGNERTPKLIDAVLRVSLDEEEPAPLSQLCRCARRGVWKRSAGGKRLRPLLAFPALDSGRARSKRSTACGERRATRRASSRSTS